MNKIFYNGNIYTQDIACPKAQGIVIENGIISSVGTNAQVLSHKKNDSILSDLQGKTILPGLIDTHMHLLFYAKENSFVDLSDTKSLKELKEKCSARLSLAEKNNKWIQGIGFNQDYWDIKKIPTRDDLDSISTDVPITVRRSCYHITVCNSKALKLANLYDFAPDGILRENDQSLLSKALPNLTASEIEKLILSACDNIAATGITEVHSDDFSIIPGDGGKTIMSCFKDLAAKGNLPIRIYQQCNFENLKQFKTFLADGNRTGNDYGMYRIGPLKIIGDGSLGAHSAAMLSPYLNDPNTSGNLNYTDDEIYQLCKTAHNNGMQIAIHCIGDRTLEQSLHTLQRINIEKPIKDSRHGIIHCQIMSEKQQDEFKKQNLLAYVQPIFIKSDMNIVNQCVGDELARSSYNWRRFVDLDVHQSGGSDCPVESFNPFPNMEYAITRTNIDTGKSWYKENGLTLEEAIKMFTLDGAYASFSENERGSISVGKKADFIIINEDILNVPVNYIHNIKPLLTVVNGKISYKSKLFK